MKRVALLAAVGVMIGATANAAPISVFGFTEEEYASRTVNAVATEDFESADSSAETTTLSNYAFKGVTNGGVGEQFGELVGGIDTAVGRFTTLGGEGSGSTARTFDRDGDNKAQTLALQYDPAVNGQGNILPALGNWSLNSNDTRGMRWLASLSNGQRFNSLVFALRDAADAGQKKLTITSGGHTMAYTNWPNNNEQIFVINFLGGTTSAQLDIQSSINDGFTLDGAAINAVPLPAPILMLLAGLGALFGVSRQRRRKAQG